MALLDEKAEFFGQDLGEETVTYTPTGGTAKSISAFVDETAEPQEPYVDGVEFARATLEVHADDVATPRLNDKYTFRGYDWLHVSMARSGSFFTILVERDDSTES